MYFEQASDGHHCIFAAWRQGSRLEERTCRPVIEGRKVSPCSEVITFTFLVDEIEEPVGRFDYFDINSRNRSAEFGYTVNPNYRQQGIGTKMLAIAIAYLFSNTNLNKLYCQTAAFNIASIKLLEKLGFSRDGTLREHHELDSQFWDDYIYSILRREWERVS
jgi:[ribosomal protein S5]-alanine N-acetyltransferase